MTGKRCKTTLEQIFSSLFTRPARHVVEEEKDIKRAMEFLHEYDRLKIEDILPFFPDFVTIDHFKASTTKCCFCWNPHIYQPLNIVKRAHHVCLIKTKNICPCKIIWICFIIANCCTKRKGSIL